MVQGRRMMVSQDCDRREQTRSSRLQVVMQCQDLTCLICMAVPLLKLHITTCMLQKVVFVYLMSQKSDDQSADNSNHQVSVSNWRFAKVLSYCGKAIW